MVQPLNNLTLPAPTESSPDNTEIIHNKSQLINFEFLFEEFKRRFVRLMSQQFRDLDLSTSIEILQPNLSSQAIGNNQRNSLQVKSHLLEHAKVEFLKKAFNMLDLKRLENYSQGLIDYHLIRDLVPLLSQSFFLNRFGVKVRMSYSQSVILAGMGLQHRDLNWLIKEIDIDPSQILALFNKAVKKMTKHLKDIQFKYTLFLFY